MILTLRPLTDDDLVDLPDDGNRYEIIGGELVVTPPATAGHQRVMGTLLLLLDDYARSSGKGEVMFAPFDIVLGHFDVVKPDLAYVSPARGSVPDDHNRFAGAPDLMVEVLCPLSRRIDRVRKMALYCRAGIPEYWIADPERRALEAYVLDGQEYRPVLPDADGWLTSRAISGLRVDPAAIFARLQ